MTAYPFLALCGLFCLPVMLVGIFRRDLRIHMARMAVLSLPFAFTEFLFYPDYWDPPFLFDFARKYGFGLEDFLFVAALGATAIGVYPFISGKRFQAGQACCGKQASLKATVLIGSALLLALIAGGSGIPAIYSAPIIMIGIAVVLLFQFRRDLWGAAGKGGVTPTMLRMRRLTDLTRPTLPFPEAPVCSWKTS